MKALFKILFLSVGAFGLTACGYTADSATGETGGEGASASEEVKAEWLTDYEEALETSRESERLILMNFTGSDWCPPCIQMKNDVLSEEAFREFAAENLVLLELDFPRNKPQEAEIEQQNRGLAEQFGIQGFPTFVVLDDEGEEVNRTVGYMRGGPEAFIAWIRE